MRSENAEPTPGDRRGARVGLIGKVSAVVGRDGVKLLRKDGKDIARSFGMRSARILEPLGRALERSTIKEHGKPTRSYRYFDDKTLMKYLVILE